MAALLLGDTLVPLRSGQQSRSSIPNFDLSPIEAEIAAGGTQKLSVRFNASHASDKFFQVRCPINQVPLTWHVSFAP